MEEIVVCANDENRKERYAEILTEHRIENVRLLIDEKIDHLGGPIVAILTGLKSVEAEFCLTIPCDMPLLQPRVIEYLFNSARPFRAVVPMWPNGRLETLTLVLKRTGALKITNILCQLGRPRSDDIIRGSLKVLFASIVGEIRALDPELESFVNINSREDLIRLQPRRGQGVVTENLELDVGSLPMSELQSLQDASQLCRIGKFLEASRVFSSSAAHLEEGNSFFWAAVSRENEGKSLLSLSRQQSEPEQAVKHASSGKNAILKAAHNYGLEAEMHENARCVFLSERARSDKAWCESLANDQRSKSNRYLRNSTRDKTV